MTHKWKVRGSIAILVFMTVLVLVGCSFSSPFLSKHDEKRTLLIQKAPIRIYMSGQFDDLDARNINQIVRELDKCRYYPYNFDTSFTVNQDIELEHKHSSKVKYESDR